MSVLIIIGFIILVMGAIKVPNGVTKTKSHNNSIDLLKGTPYYKILKRKDEERNSNKF